MRLCVDAGGTYFRYKLYENDQERDSGSEKTGGIGLLSWIEKLLEKHKGVKTVVVGFAGQVKDGIILGAPNITIDEPKIKNYFETRYDLEFFIQNDLSLAALAEAHHFSSEEICALYVGSGLGLGVITKGRLLVGYNSLAGEVGHIPYKNSPFVCGCGKNNCLELFASGSGLAKSKKMKNIEQTRTLEELRVSDNGNEKVLYEEFEEALMYGVGVVVTLFNPQVLVLGGGIIQSEASLFERVLDRYKEFCMPQATEGLRIEKTKLQNAVLDGAKIYKESL